MTRYRVKLPQADLYRPDNREVAEETLADLAIAFIVLLACIFAIVVWVFILAAAAS